VYVNKELAKKVIKQSLQDSFAEIRESNDLMLKLLEESDWSIVIKSHALIESVVTELLISHTNEEMLRATIKRLPLSDSSIGKLKVAKDLGLMDSCQRTFIRKLSELRNDLVHNIENVSFSFKNFVDALDASQKKSWLKAIAWQEENTDTSQAITELFESMPKISFWLSINSLVSVIQIEIAEIKGTHKINAEAAAFANEIVKKIV
jgi:DNA-binding MltR family transcriptional regulator